MTAQLPIGVFDSGVGGLTVLKALKQLCPQEDYIYLGDTARLPYGTKSKETVIQYALSSTALLVEQGIKCLVVACNTASSVALPALHRAYNIPVIGVIEPGVDLLATQMRQGSVAILATESTTRWHAYQNAIADRQLDLNVSEWSCPLFVALAEEGWTQGPLVEQIIQEALGDLVKKPPQSMILGCTHFPLLQQAIQNVFPKAFIINSAQAVAYTLQNLLEDHQLKHDQAVPGHTRFLATDGLERFIAVAQRFLNRSIEQDHVALVSTSSLLPRSKSA